MESPYIYDIRLPSHASSGKHYPAIFALHGIGSNEQHMLALMDDLKEDFILIGVRGDLKYENGYAYYYLKEYGNPERPLFDHSVEKLLRFVEYASNKYPVDQGRRYLLGFSQGAILSMTLALVLGNAIKGIVAMNGYIPSFVKEEFPLKSVQHMNIFLSHGGFDPIFPVNIGHETYDYLRERAGSVKYVIYPVGHEISSDNRQDFVRWLSQDASGINRN